MKHCQLVFILLLVWPSFGMAGEFSLFNHNPNFSTEVFKTNSTFVTSDGHVYLSPSTGTLDSALIDAAKKTRESLPAKDFPEGNWGELFQGVQLSLRLDKPVYTKGETVNMTVLVRNVTNEFFLFPRTTRENFGSPVDFVISTESGELVPAKTGHARMVSPSAGSTIVVIPGTQRKYEDRLNNTYSLTNGHYLVQASINASHSTSSNTLEWIEIKSAPVSLEIR